MVRIANTVWPEQTLDPHEVRQRDEAFRSPHVRRRVLAESDERVLGYGVFEHKANMYHPQRFWLSLDVLPDYRRRGSAQRSATTCWQS